MTHPASKPLPETITLPDGPAPGATDADIPTTDELIHGMYLTYHGSRTRLPCPCAPCRAANAENSRQYRARNRTTTLTVDGHHGDMLADYARRNHIPKTEAVRRAIRLLHLIEASEP